MVATVSDLVSGLVLAGGAGLRMGRDKRLLHVGDRPLLRRAVDAVAAVCDEVLVVVSSRRPLPPSLLPDGVRVLVDRRDDEGPLAGIEAGLRAASHDPVLVLAGDHPAADPGVLRTLVADLASTGGVDARVLGTGSGPQPLVAAYRRGVAATVTSLLDRGERRARVLLEHLDVAVVAERDWRAIDPRGGTAVDLDTPRDVADWEAGAVEGTRP